MRWSSGRFFDELLYLPEIDTSLQLLLGILTPTMDSAIRSIQDDDVDVLDEVFDKVVAESTRVADGSSWPRP